MSAIGSLAAGLLSGDAAPGLEVAIGVESGHTRLLLEAVLVS